MCKEMMVQRNKIESDLEKDLERALENIRNNGVWDSPTALVNMERLFIANREYFENQGFYFEPATKIEKGKVFYWAWLKLGGEGKLASKCWDKIREARKEYIKNQRKEIFKLLRETQGCPITVDMNWLLFDNKMFFEEVGYYFESETRIENGKTVCFARMKKRN